MSQILEEMREESRREAIQENNRKTVIRMLADGMLPLNKIAEYSGLSIDEVKEIKISLVH